MEFPKKRKAGGDTSKAPPTKLKKLRRPAEETRSKPVPNKKIQPLPSSAHDAFLAQEEKEIARLEKLLGIKESGKGRKKCAAKLNKEYAMYEGMDGNFGDFLMELDDLTDMIVGKNKKDRVFAKGNTGGTDEVDEEDESPEEIHVVGHCIDDDAQEQSDIDDNDVEEEEEEVEEEGEEEEEEDEEAAGEEVDGNDDDDDDDDDVDDDADDDAASDRHDAPRLNSHEYHPTQGEDIYGRIKNNDQTGATAAKYIAPARRKQLLTTIDESSEQVKVIRKSMRGIMNRLSDQTKDATARAMKGIFDGNSMSVANTVLKDCVMEACCNPSQMMTSLIPIYAAVIAALHVVVGIEVGAYIIEMVANSLHTAILTERTRLHERQGLGLDAPVHSKESNNALLLLVYLYNLRVVHHTLIVDIMHLLAGSFEKEAIESSSSSSSSSAARYGGGSSGGKSNGNNNSSSSKEVLPIGELEVELLIVIVDHCGPQLRADDPLGIKNAILKLNKRATQSITSSSSSSASSSSSMGKSIGKAVLGSSLGIGSGLGSDTATSSHMSGRLRFMIEAFADMKNNKSRRIQSTHADVVKGLRKWLGTIKNSLGSSRSGADQCLRVTLADLLDAEKKGRWWRAGASWMGNSNSNDPTDQSSGRSSSISGHHGVSTNGSMDDIEGSELKGKKRPDKKNEEEERLLVLAKKMRFNTTTRQTIFVVIASSRDVDDAFERLQRLGLKGKQDREVVRVISECCAQEKTYNAFYAELAALLCTHNRQYKTTVQFTFWDNFKLLAEDDNTSTRRVVNLARLLAHLLCTFHLPLAVLKPIDIGANLNASMILFLATFFMSLFSAKVSEDTFQTILDRVATTKDFMTVRDGILFFLQTHLKQIPRGLEGFEMMQKRRRMAVSTMESMNVLNFSAARMEEEDDNP